VSDLRRKYFGDEVSERAKEKSVREEIVDRKRRQSEWVTAEYMEEFKAKIETWMKAYEPKPASHEEMLFTSGVRKGVLIVKEHIEMLERQLRESQNVGD
jgi:hypothetical protein